MVWGQFRAPVTYPSRVNSTTYPIGGSVDPRVGMSVFWRKGKSRTKNIRSYLVTVPTELSHVSLSVRCLKQTVLSNDKLIHSLNIL